MKVSSAFSKLARRLFAVAAFFLLGACASIPFSSETMRSIDRSASMGMVRNDPETYRDKVILTGGQVVGVKNSSEGSELEVVEYTLGSSGIPYILGDSAGRFLARSRSFFDPEVYRKGRVVTLAGAVTGSEERTIEGATYSYVVLAIREIHLWRPEEVAYYLYPPPYYSDPYFYDYYYDPYYGYGGYYPYPGYYGYGGGRQFEKDRHFEGGRSRQSEGGRDFERGKGKGSDGVRGFEGSRGHGGGGKHWGGGGGRHGGGGNHGGGGGRHGGGGRGGGGRR